MLPEIISENYLRGLLQLTNISQHVQCRWNNFEIILELFVGGWSNFISVSDVVAREIKNRK